MAQHTRHRFSKSEYALDQLNAEIAALNVPGFSGLGGGEGVVDALFTSPITEQEIGDVAGVIAAHTPSAQFAKQRAVQSAVAGLLLSNDPATQALLKILEVQQTRANDLAELLAKVLGWAKLQPGFPAWVGRESEYAAALAAAPRFTESAIQTRVVQMMLATDVPQSPTPLAPGGG